jgi:uncharacterized iron-regulated membrane protein
MRKLLFRLHLYVSMAAGFLILILGLTGCVMAFETELADLLHARLVYVAPGAKLLSLADIGSAVSRKFPGERVAGYAIATLPNHSYRVLLRRRTVFVNQYTGEILGTLPTPDPVTAFLGNVHQFHLNLLLRSNPALGKTIMTWASVGMIFLGLSGLCLWWPQKRAGIDWKSRAGAGSRKFWWDVHNTAGIFSLVFLVILALTGVLVGFEKRAAPIFYQITGSHPSPPPATPEPREAGAKPISLDQAVAIARAALPGAAPFSINAPGPDGTFQIRARFPEDLTPGGRSMVVVDGYSGKILFAQGSRTAPGGERLRTLNRAIHTGDIFGLASKIVMSLASLMAAVLWLSGAGMWWKRRKLKGIPP